MAQKMKYHVQSGGQVKQLGLIFMSEDDANALVEKVKRLSSA